MKRPLNGGVCATISGSAGTQIVRCFVWEICSRTEFTHNMALLSDTKMRSGSYPLFHLALLNDFDSFALWINV